MSHGSYKIATVWGIPIKVHISLLLLLLYVIHRTGGLGSGYVLDVIILECLVFASIALHELGHSFVAIRKGCKVREITLMFMGGAAQMEQIPSRPRDELTMALAGPAVSLTLGLLGFFGGRSVGAQAPHLGGILMMAGIVNLILGVFNLLPAFPMDGGRVLRAALTPRKGRLRATFIAARLGRAVAIAFMFIGVFGLRGVPFFSPGNYGLIAVGIFVYISAGREYRFARTEEAMKHAYGPQAAGWAEPPPRTDPHEDEDRVVISPPPYERGPNTTAEIRPERRRRFPFG